MGNETYLGLTFTYDEAMKRLAGLVSSQCGERITEPIELDGDLNIPGFDKGNGLYIRFLSEDLFGVNVVVLGEKFDGSHSMQETEDVRRTLEGKLKTIGIDGEIGIHTYSYIRDD